MPAQGCERAAVAQGNFAALVGYGFEDLNGTAGTKRVVEAEIYSVSKEIRIGDSARGTCAGDSGGPAFIRIPRGSDSPGFEWRVVGLLSSGIEGEGCGTGYYTDLASHVDWLQEETDRVLTPCFADDGSWAPTARCVRPSLNAEGVTSAEEPVEYSDTCGPPYQPKVSPTQSCALARLLGSRSPTAACWLIAAPALLGVGRRARRARRGGFGPPRRRVQQ